MKNLGITAIVAGLVAIILDLVGVLGQGGRLRTVMVAAVILLAVGILLNRRGRGRAPDPPPLTSEHPMSKHPVKKRPREHAVVELLFATGAILVIVGLLYALRRSWPSLDPFGLVMLVGIGLLLVVVCERLRLILREVQALTTLIRRATAEAPEKASK